MGRKNAARSHAVVESISETWVCPACGQRLRDRFCPACGERKSRPHDLSVRSLAEQAFETVTHADGRVFRSFRDLLTRPGELTHAFGRGLRKRYLSPFALFLVVNAIFFATGGAGTFGTPLRELQDDGRLTNALVQRALAARSTTVEAFAPAYDHAAVVNAKAFPILMVAPLGVLTTLLFGWRTLPLGLHSVFALHFVAFLLLLQIPLRLWVVLLLVFGSSASAADESQGYISFAASALFFFVAIQRVYGSRGVARALKTALLTGAVPVIWFGYRYAIVAITFYSTKLG